MSFIDIDRMLNGLFMGLVAGGAILLGIVVHAVLGLENWLLWSIIYTLVPLAVLWGLASLMAHDEAEDYGDDLIAPALRSVSRPKKRFKFSMIVECVIMALLILCWPVVAAIIILFLAWVMLSSELEIRKQHHSPVAM